MSRRRKALTPEEVEANRAAFARAQAVLDGADAPDPDGGVPKMLSLLFETGPRMHLAGVDGRVARDGFFVRYRPGEGESEYFMTLAAPTLREILRQAGVERVAGRLSARRLEVDRSSLLQPFTEGFESELLLWLERSDDEVRFALRRHSAELVGTAWPTPHPKPPQTPRYREVAMDCPHCAAPLTRVRDLGDAGVCPSCTRSFRFP